jgi:hypothetical protein
MKQPRGCGGERIEEIEVGDIGSNTLRYAAVRNPYPGRAFHMVIVVAAGAPETTEPLQFAATSRAGTAWSGHDGWVDAVPVDRSLLRWLQGAGRLSSARSSESGDS